MFVKGGQTLKKVACSFRHFYLDRAIYKLTCIDGGLYSWVEIKFKILKMAPITNLNSKLISDYIG